MRIAALDLGTNSFLCLIGEGDSSGLKKVLADHMEIVRLGQEVNQTGKFHVEALVRARNCLERFAVEIKKHNVDKIQAVATSAARDVSNKDELFKIGRDLGIPISIIAGPDEARISYAGATWGHLGHNETTCVVDVGGGSTEYIVGCNDLMKFGQSLNIGGVRLTEKFISIQPIIEEEDSKLQLFIKEQLSQLNVQLEINSAKKIIAVAGTPTALASIELGGFDEEKVDGYFVSLERLLYWKKEFKNSSVEEIKTKYALGGRADIIYAGISILIQSVQLIGLPGIFVSTKGVRYGVAQEMLSNSSSFQS